MLFFFGMNIGAVFGIDPTLLGTCGGDPGLFLKTGTMTSIDRKYTVLYSNGCDSWLGNLG